MSIYRRGKTWWTDMASAKGRVRVSLKTTNKETAKAREAELRNAAERERVGLEIRDKNPTRATLSEAVDAYLAGRAKLQAQHSRLTYTLNKHVKGDEIGAMPLEKVTRGEVAKWLDRREAAGLSPTTCNRLRANLSAIFSSLIEREEFHGDNPCRRLRPRKQKLAKNRKFDPSYVRALIDNAPTEGWQLAFALAAYAGLRRGEIERLQWQDIDLEGRVLTVQQSKTDVRRLVGLHRELVQLLADARGKAKGTDLVATAGWQKSAVVLRNALTRAEIEVPTSVQACFHSLRHVWASQMTDCGADPFITRFMGWGPPKGDVMASSYMKPRAALIEAIDHLRYPRSETSPKARHNLDTRGENGDE